jgi:hypothetical protein
MKMVKCPFEMLYVNKISRFMYTGFLQLLAILPEFYFL